MKNVPRLSVVFPLWQARLPWQQKEQGHYEAVPERKLGLLQTPLLKLQCVQESPGDLADSAGPGRGLRLCISDDLLDGADAAGPQPRLARR